MSLGFKAPHVTASMLRAGHRGHAGPQLEPQQRLRRVPLLLSRRGDVRRLQAQRHVVLLHKVRRRRGGAQGGPGADLPGQIMLVTSTATRSPAASTPAIGDSSETTGTLVVPALHFTPSLPRGSATRRLPAMRCTRHAAAESRPGDEFTEGAGGRICPP